VSPDLLSTPPSPRHWHGKLALTYARSHSTTQAIHSWAQAPLKVQRSFYPESPEICHSVILHTAGGVVGGDRLSLDLRLQAGANALVTTAAAGKIYRTNGLTAEQTVQVSIAENACLEWLPQETIVFEQAQYRQGLRVDLAPGACWLGWEITRFGRTARGESFYAGDWRSHTEVWQAGVPLWIDRQWLPGSKLTFHSPHGLAGYPVVGSFALVGQPVATELVDKARSLWSGAGEAGVSRLRSGVICRYRGHATVEVRHWFMAVWHLVRAESWQRQPCVPRVWQW
jgi:urease accessory protein